MNRAPVSKRIIALLANAMTLHHALLAQDGNSIILGRPTDHSITASILCEQSVDLYAEFGISPGIYTGTTAVMANVDNTPVELELDGLLPDTRYYYRIHSRPTGGNKYTATREFSFHTQRAPGSTFTFTVEADEHLYDHKGSAALYGICLQNQAMDRPDFMISLGDIFGDDHEPELITSGELDTLHRHYRPFLGSLCHSVPFYVCLGNHEGESDFHLAQHPPDNLAIWATQWRKIYYPNPYPNDFYSGNMDEEPWGIGNPENYYAWTWGDALFVVLDVYRDQCDTSASPGGWNWSLGRPQYTWLKNTLETSPAAHKFVFAHHVRGWGRGGAAIAPFFEWGGYANDGTTYQFDNKRPGWGAPIHQLFVDNGVDIFFQGHDHLFAHEILDGVTYQEVPMPSDTTYAAGMLANADAYTADTVGGSGHLRVTVEPTCVSVEFVRAWLPADTLDGMHHNGEVAFSYAVGECTTSVDDLGDKSEEISVWPNPARDGMNVRLPPNTRKLRIQVFDALGQEILDTRLPGIDVRNIPNGMYFLRIEADEVHAVKKVLINH